MYKYLVFSAAGNSTFHPLQGLGVKKLREASADDGKRFIEDNGVNAAALYVSVERKR